MAGGGAAAFFWFAGALDALCVGGARVVAGGGAGRDGDGAGRRVAVEAEREGGRVGAARRPPLGREDLLPMLICDRGGETWSDKDENLGRDPVWAQWCLVNARCCCEA